MNVNEKQTVIQGYFVELEVDCEDGITQCFVIKGRHSASLAGLIYTGCLSAPIEGDQRVPRSVINQIEAWALAEGY